jgi:hypothetical protein
MNLKRLLAIFALGAIAFQVQAMPTVWYVHPDSSLNSIQDALDSCSTGDIVLVGPGRYVENIVWPYTHGIKLISERGYEATVIDADSAGSGIVIKMAVDTTTVIRGFTIQNGFAGTSWPGWGGAIACSTLASPTIVDDKMTHCTAYTGGAIHVWGGSPLIKNNIICDNTAIGGGGGIYLISSSARILNNVIERNAAPSGAGIYPSCATPSNPLLIQCNTIRHNYGDGIFFSGSVCVIESCSIYGNTENGIHINGAPTTIIQYCNICSNNAYGVCYDETAVVIPAENNWWGHLTGPYHPSTNPGGQGDQVSDHVDYAPWLGQPWSVQETPVVRPGRKISAIVVAGPLPPQWRDKGIVYTCAGRRVAAADMRPGVYFLDLEGKEIIKIVKVR